MDYIFFENQEEQYNIWKNHHSHGLVLNIKPDEVTLHQANCTNLTQTDGKATTDASIRLCATSMKSITKGMEDHNVSTYKRVPCERCKQSFDNPEEAPTAVPQEDTSNYNWHVIIVVLIAIFIILIYLISLGKVNLGEVVDNNQELRDTKEEALRKHKRLKAHIGKKEKLAQKLQRRFRWIYTIVRILLVALWGGTMYAFHKIGHINTLSDFRNYSQISVLVLVTVNFIVFGTITEFKSFIHLIRIRIENWIYGKYQNLDEGIEEQKTELKKLERKIK